MLQYNPNMMRIVFFISLVLLQLSCSKDPVISVPTAPIPPSLPLISIVKNSPINLEKEPCEITFFETTDTVTIPATIKRRGGVSIRYDKHSFSVELDSKHALGDLPNDDDWILNANYIDKTFMRHKMSYDLFKQMHPNNIASSCAYVNVHLNDEYNGLYVLMEEINGGMVELDKDDSQAMLFKDPPIFHEHILEVVQDSLNYYQQKFPDILEDDKTAYLETFKDFLFYSTDEIFRTELANWVDLDNIIDWHLLLLLSNNSDGIMKNFYLYKLDADTPFRIAIWDYDHSFGRDGDNELNMMERPLDVKRSVLIKRLLEISEIQYFEKLQQRWQALRANGVFSVDNIQQLVDANDKIISHDLADNFAKWPVDNHWYYDANDYEAEIAIIHQFTELRISQLDDYFME